MLKLQYFGHLMQRTNSLEKTLMLGKIEGERRRGAAEDEMDQLSGHKFEETGRWWRTGEPGVLQSMVLQSWMWLSDCTATTKNPIINDVYFLTYEEP